MRSLQFIGTIVVFPALASLTCSLHGQMTDEEERRRIDSLVRQLADKKYSKRQAAGKELEGLGEKALPAIRGAENAGDLELSTRAKQVARAIMRASGKSKSIGLEMVLVDEGRFDMGAQRFERGRRNDETVHSVRITRPYLLGKYEVTQEEFEKVMNFNPSWFAPKAGGALRLNDADTRQFPVEKVTWFDAVEFCNRLSKLDGYQPYYTLTNVRKQNDSITSANVAIRGGHGYRLPTEAEWEFACRAWTDTAYHYGHTNTGAEANLKPGPAIGYGSAPNWPVLDRSAKVGNYKPNLRGLFEMHGNIGEWCGDWYDKDYYTRSPVDDPQGPESGTHRVIRGGSWLQPEGSCRAASRFMLLPHMNDYTTGFRVARSP